MLARSGLVIVGVALNKGKSLNHFFAFFKGNCFHFACFWGEGAHVASSWQEFGVNLRVVVSDPISIYNVVCKTGERLVANVEDQPLGHGHAK